jgi:hypothetical protein
LFIDSALFGQFTQRCQHDVTSVHFEVTTQVFAAV